MDKQRYIRMNKSEFIEWCPNAVFLDRNKIEDVGFDLLDNYQKHDYGVLSAQEQAETAMKCGHEANKIILKLMKGGK